MSAGHTEGEWILHSAKYPHGWKADIFLADGKSVLDATHIARCFLPAPYKPPLDALQAIGTERELGPKAEANARFIVAACNSFMLNFGPHAVSAAEGDLLGKALEALRIVTAYAQTLSDDELGSIGREGIKSSRLILSQAQAREVTR